MSGRKHHFKGWGKKFFHVVKILCVCVGVIVVVSTPALGSFFLLSMDKYHECYRSFIINNCLKRDNYYGGETWLSVAATLVGAVISATPGLMCGIFALVQTQRLHSLEARYHRPMMELEKVGFSFVKLSNIRDENSDFCMNDFDIRQRNGVYEAERQTSEWWIDLEIDLFSNNEIAVKNMEIESVTFDFPNVDSDEEYELRLLDLKNNAVMMRSFRRDIREGRAVYTLSWSLHPFKGFKHQDTKLDFERSIGEFVFYSSEGQNPRYSRMELSVNMNVSYEYGEKQKRRCLLRAVFDAECSELSKDIVEIKSTDGYFTYEV